MSFNGSILFFNTINLCVHVSPTLFPIFFYLTTWIDFKTLFILTHIEIWIIPSTHFFFSNNLTHFLKHFVTHTLYELSIYKLITEFFSLVKKWLNFLKIWLPTLSCVYRSVMLMVFLKFYLDLVNIKLCDFCLSFLF